MPNKGGRRKFDDPVELPDGPKLGVAIVGGLIVAQFFALYTTPVIYVLMDGLRRREPIPVHFAAGAEPIVAQNY